MNTTLPTDSQQRKEIPLVSGCLDYFPAALAGVASISYQGNQKHNPGQPLHHARGKSNDHADCILRHLMDVQGLLAEMQRLDLGEDLDERAASVPVAILAEASALAWRALALSQELHERFGAPLAPGARLPEAAPVDIYAVAAANIAQSAAALDKLPVRADLAETPAVAEPRKPLQVEVGKRYVRRDGSVSGVLNATRSSTFPVEDRRDSYTLGGRAWSSIETERDLVSEYVETVAQE